jgi:hypothetical protein
MRHLLRKFVAAGWGVLACMGALGTTAAASSVYNVDYDFWSHFGWYNYVTGRITTDGAVGALVPENILNFNITRTSIGYPYGYGPITLSLSASSDSGGTLMWTPGSFIATPTELDFDFGSPVAFTSSLSFLSSQAYPNTVLGFSPCIYGPAQPCGVITGETLWYTNGQIWGLAGVAVLETPSPVAGAGLPGLILASGGLLGWWRRRRQLASFRVN